MATLSKDKRSGTYRVQFVDRDRKRKAIRLGKIRNARAAESARIHIERLIEAQQGGGVLPAATAEWVADQDDKIRQRLAKVGLISERKAATLALFVDDYIDRRADKEGSIKQMKLARNDLVSFFGADRPLREITPGDADDWYQTMQDRLAVTTTCRRGGYAKEFFRSALRKRLVEVNPFADLKTTVRANSDRFYFVTREESEKVIAACLSSQHRLVFALARYGGLRCPSEVLALQWGHIDWERGRMDVQSPKTARHGKSSRLVPLFPELLPFLEESFDLAEEGEEYLIQHRGSESYYHGILKRTLDRAGIPAWPKLYQNCRSTRETELAEEFPIHVVTAWLGNTPKVANAHYLQVTDEHFERAASKAAQKAAHQMSSDSIGNHRTGASLLAKHRVLTLSDDPRRSPVKHVTILPIMGEEGNRRCERPES